LQAAQPVPHRLAVRHGHPGRHGVDEHADHRLHVRQLGRAPGDGGAEDDVVLAAAPRQQQRPGALHDGVDSQSELLRGTAQGGGFRFGQPEPDGLGGLGAVRLDRLAVVGQRSRRAQSGQHPAPVLLGLNGVLPGEPGEIVAERTAVHRARYPVTDERRVLLGDLGEDLPHAPAVEQHVVRGPHDEDLVLSGTGDGQPHQRRGGQLQPGGPVLGQQVVQGVRTAGVVQSPPVVVRHGQGDLPVHDLHGLVDTLPDHGGP
jgi:hypothetical protein